MRLLTRFMAMMAIVFTAFTAPAMAQEDGASARMKRVMPYMEKFVSSPEEERSLLKLVYRIKSKSQPEDEIRAWYNLNGQRHELPLNARGELQQLPSLSTWKANPMVETNVPRKDVRLAMRMYPNVVHSTVMDAPTLVASLAQADHGIRKVSGIFGWFRPKLEGLRFEVFTGTTAEIVFKNGETSALEVKYIDPVVTHIDVDRDVLARASEIRFTKAPNIIHFRE